MYPILSPRAQQSLTLALALPARGSEQDWDIELADAGRVEEFVGYYEEHRHDLDTDEKQALASLVLSSLDDLCSQHDVSDDLADRVRELLSSEPDLFADLVRYWGAEVDPFSIAPLLQSLSWSGDEDAASA